MKKLYPDLSGSNKYRIPLSFKGETLGLVCNGRTTLTTGSDGEYLDFPIPSIKGTCRRIEKLWRSGINVPDAKHSDQIEYQVRATAKLVLESWQTWDSLTTWIKARLSRNTHKKSQLQRQNVVLPKYNNQGEDFFYTVEEVNVPDDFESAVTNEDGTIIITNTKKRNIKYDRAKRNGAKCYRTKRNGTKYDRAKCYRTKRNGAKYDRAKHNGRQVRQSQA